MGIGQRHGRPHVRKPAHETIEQRAQLAEPERDRRGNAQRAFRLAAHRDETTVDLVDRTENPLDAREIQLADFRQRLMAGAALKQACAKARLERVDQPARHRRRHAQPRCRPAKPAFPCHRHECPNRLKLVHLSGFPCAADCLDARARRGVATDMQRPGQCGGTDAGHGGSGRHARARRVPACNGRKPASAGPMHEHSNSSPESFPVVRSGDAGGIRRPCDGHTRIARVHWLTFLSAGAMV